MRYLLKTNYFTGKTGERDLAIGTLQLDVKLSSQLIQNKYKIDNVNLQDY
jgi:hypothetical protein